jgi:hypothetical protein
VAISTGFVVAAGSSSPNQLSVVREIDNYILTSALALGAPFLIKTISPTENS